MYIIAYAFQIYISVHAHDTQSSINISCDLFTSGNNIPSWKLLQNSQRAWKFVLKCPQPQYQSRNKILKAKGNTSNYGWKEPQWKCEQTQGLIKSKRVFEKVRHIIQVIKHPVRALCALLELLTMKPLFIIKSESPPYIFFKWLSFFLQLT